MKLTKGFKWALAAALSVATVAATVSIANAYMINEDTNSSHEIDIISNSGGHFKLEENDAIKQARSFNLNVEIIDYYSTANATLEYGSYDSNGNEVKLGELVKNEAFSGDLTATLSAADVANGKFWLRAADYAYSSIVFHSISFFDESGNCILYGSADSNYYTRKWTFYQLNAPTISVDGIANPDGSYFESAEVSAKAATLPMTTLYYNGSNQNACTWGVDISHVLVKDGDTLSTDNITFTDGGCNEYVYSAYTTATLTDNMNGDATVTLYSPAVEKTVRLTDKYVLSRPDEPVVVDDSELKATTFEQRTEEGIVSFANAWSGSPVLSGGLDLVSDTRPNCRIAKIVDRNEAGTGIQTYFVDVTYTDVEGFDPAVRAEQTVTLVGEADVSKLDVPNGYDNSVSVSDVKIASDYLTGVTLTPPTKTTYTYGESLDLTGGKLTLSYEQSADAEIPLTDSKVSVSGSVSSLGTNTITVTYNAAQGEAKRDADLTKTFEVTVNPEQVADPVIAPASGTFNAPVEVTITTATSSAKIFYTTDGSEPTANSTFYEGAFTVSETATVKAIAVKEYWTDSNVVSASYELAVADPVIAPATRTFTSKLNVTINCATDGAKIYYTTDGSDPTNDSTLYEEAFTISATTTVKAIAVKDNWTASGVVSETYTKKSGGGSSGGSSSVINHTVFDPKIDDVPHTWAQVNAVISKLPENGTVTVDLNGNISIPSDVLTTIRTTKATVTFMVSKTRSFVISGAELTDIPSKSYSTITDSPSLVTAFNFNEVGGTVADKFIVSDLGVPAKLSVNLGKSNAGKYASLMLLNKQSGKMEFVGAGIVNADGIVILPYAGQGDFAVVVDAENNMLGDVNNDGKLTAADSSLILRSIVFGDKVGANADFNRDGKTNAADASDILRNIIGL